MDNKLIILAFVVGAFLSLCSTFVVRSHSEGWTEIFPLSLYSVGVNAGGWPFGFVGFGTRPPLKLIKEIYEFGPIFFLLNTIFWGLSCFLTVTLMEFCVQHCLLKSTWLQWLALLIFLAPALYGLIGSALYKLSFFNLPSASLPNFKFAAAKWLSFDEPENALVFINITYWGFVGLFLTLLLLDIFHDQKVILFRYPIFTAGVILFGFMLNHPLLQTYLQQRRDRPFIVDSITITPRENGAGYILEYRLIFPELPKEEIVYEMSCSGFDRLRKLNDYCRSARRHYVEQIDGVIYEQTDSSRFHDGTFSQAEALQGEIAIHSKTLPKYFFLSLMEEFEPYELRKGIGKELQWYLVPLTQDMIVSGEIE